MSNHTFTIIPERDITFQPDKNGDQMAMVTLDVPIQVNEDELSRFFAHSKWSAPDYKLLMQLADSSDEIPMSLDLVQKNSYWNLVKGSLKKK